MKAFDCKIPLTTLFNGLRCPHCESNKIVKNGQYKHTQLYKCKQCQTRFRSTKGTIFQGIQKKTEFKQYAQCLEDGLTIRQAAKQIGISIATSFAWRHKHLASFSHSATQNQTKLRGIGILEMPYSEKGRKKPSVTNSVSAKSLVVIDTQGSLSLKLLTDHCSLKKALIQYNQNGVQLASERKQALTKALNHIADVKQMQKKDISKYIQTHLSKAKSQLDQWLSRFRGVSTKYLQQYWDWYSRIIHPQSQYQHELYRQYADTNAIDKYRALVSY